MAKVKIFLGKGETQHDAEEALRKALDHHSSGDVHSSHKFEDPAMVAVSDRMEQTFKTISKEMTEEIIQALEDEYKSEYGN